MLSKILKENQNFISGALLLLSGLCLFLLKSSVSVSEESMISTGLFIVVLVLGVVYARRSSFFSRAHYFEYYYLLFSALLVCCFDDLPFFAGYLFLSIVIFQLLDERDVFDRFLSPFDTGFFMALAVVMYPPFWCFGVYLFFYYLFLGKTQFRSFIMSFLGFVGLWIILIELAVLFDYLELKTSFLEKLSFQLYIPSFQLLWLSPVAFMLIYFIIDYVSNINRQSVEKKKIFFNTYVFLVFALLFVVLYGGVEQNALLLLSLPLALILGNGTYYAKTWIPEVMLWGFLIALIAYQYANQIELPGVLKDITF